MNLTRQLLALAAGTAALVSIHLVADFGMHSSGDLIRRVTLAPSANRASEIFLQREGEPVMRLARAEGWTFTAPYTDAADVRAVSRLTDALAFTPIIETLSDAELLRLQRTRADFALDPPALTLGVRAGSGEWTKVSLGARTPAGDGVYASVAGLNQVFVVPTNVLAAADCPADAFRNRALFDTGADDIIGLDVRCGESGLSSFRLRNGGWMMVAPNDARASDVRVRHFLETVLSASAVNFIWPLGGSNEVKTASTALLAGYGLDAEQRVSVTLKGRDGADRCVSFGRQAGEKLVYAFVHNGAAIVTVDAHLRDLSAVDASMLTETRIFPLESAAVTTVSLMDGDATYLLARDTSGHWRLDAPVSAPAEQAEVEALVARLLALRMEHLDGQGVQVALNVKSDPVSVSRFAVLGDRRPEDLRAKEILKLDERSVRRLRVTARDGASVAVVYDPDRRGWNVDPSLAGLPQGRGRVDEASVQGMLQALNPLDAVSVVKLKVSASELGDWGLDRPYLTVAIDRVSENAVRRNILLGDVSPDGGRYVTIGSSDAVFTLSPEVVAVLSRPLITE